MTLRKLTAAVMTMAIADLASAAQAAAETPGFPHEATEAGRWSLLISVAVLVAGLPTLLYVLDMLLRAAAALRSRVESAAGAPHSSRTGYVRIVRGAVLGMDGRVSTSKTVAAVWTYAVAGALLSIVVAKWLGHGHAYGAQVKNGLQSEYALLIGGPIGAAILSKGIVSAQVDAGASKPVASAAQTSQLVTNDNGRTDLGDLQYVLFNTVALVFFFGELLGSPHLGLPTIPDVLLGLTSMSAVGYVAKKALPSSGLAITKLDPALAKEGTSVKLYVGGLIGDQGTVPPAAEVAVALGAIDAPVQSCSATVEGPVLEAKVPAGLPVGQPCDVTIKYRNQTATKTKAFTLE